MATIGLRDLFAAKITEDAQGNETYAAPVRIAKAIVAELTVQNAQASLYADDGVDVIINEFVSGTLRLTMNDLKPEIQQLLLGQQPDANGVIFSNKDDAPPYFAIAFRAKKADSNMFRYTWLYKVKFGVPAETLNTKGETITFNTPLIEGEFISRNMDGEWKADYVGLPTDAIAAAWFTTVYEKAAPPPAPEAETPPHVTPEETTPETPIEAPEEAETEAPAETPGEPEAETSPE